MNARTVSFVFGIVFMLIGIAGFVPGALHAPPAEAPALAVDSGYGYLFGLFPVNVLHNLVHLAFGIWGLLAFRSGGSAVGYLRSVAVIYGLLTVLGLIPGLNTTFGAIPIFGHDVWLHAGIALVAGIFGWGARARRPAAA